MTINKWAKPIPKLDLPPWIHTQKASKIERPSGSRIVDMEFIGCSLLE